MSLVQNHTSIALIRHPDGKEQSWLAIWKPQQGWYSFVMAERIEAESWHECLDRELSWVLPIRRGKDYIISTMARLHLEEAVYVSETAEEQNVAYEFYVVDPYGRQGKEAFSGLEDTCWLTNSELRAGRTDDGRSIDPELIELLVRADILPKG